MILLTTILFGIYAYLEGHREALYYYFRWFRPFDKVKDEHSMFTIQRAIVVVACSFIPFTLYSWWGLLSVIPIMLVFMFMHDGSYYSTYNDMDSNIYKKRWKDKSTSTSAKLSTDFVTRTILFTLGIVLAITGDILLTYYIYFN